MKYLLLLFLFSCSLDSMIEDNKSKPSEPSWVENIRQLTTYGNWCGDGHIKKAEPVDSVDLCCQKHDLCFAETRRSGGVISWDECGYGDRALCDRKLVKCMKSLDSLFPEEWPMVPIKPAKAVFYKNSAIAVFYPCMVHR